MAAEVEVVKTEVEEVKVATKVELDIAPRMDPRRSREGRGKSAVGGGLARAGCIRGGARER